ncbi:MAG: hypothetical protein WC728_02310 [Elusimicrobiota bacterium]
MVRRTLDPKKVEAVRRLGKRILLAGIVCIVAAIGLLIAARLLE